ncbi:MAG: hypothetical protein Q8K79_14550, partial [Solirubrobacteraceae bacterium]|nr:hypothetical protein [Solirubrobacteraceae bacterium]
TLPLDPIDQQLPAFRTERGVSVQLHPELLGTGALRTTSLQGGPDEQRAQELQERYADAIVSIDRFGASAPGELVLEKLGITPENVAGNVHQLLR